MTSEHQAHVWPRPRIPWPRRRSPKGMQPHQEQQRHDRPSEQQGCATEHNDAISTGSTSSSLLELMDQISNRIAHLENHQAADRRATESATSVSDAISSLATRVMELEHQQPLPNTAPGYVGLEQQQPLALPGGAAGSSWHAVPEQQQQQQPMAACAAPAPALAAGMLGCPGTPMIVPAPGLPGVFMYAPVQQQQLQVAQQMPTVTPLTPRRWAALLWQAETFGAFPGVAAEVAAPSQPARSAKWRDPAFGTVILAEVAEDPPLLVPHTESGLPTSNIPAKSEPPQPVKRPTAGRHQQQRQIGPAYRQRGNRRTN